ncbi:bifunctional (p)ppGpp synthetase/guanosine-3',5'-bis(diphosphate) 3'-pyrophosphohydrolase [Pseudomonas syringae pv. syringae]|uniref:bifunctional (p)ppGpp synthetase/guanosine-3',5'-bis(diphosphate) 3'-pyrophosphohydrolase n=1 Tax=Pseudomonas TaxID=286 RepID=UPI0006B963FB|nr:MULTISPECIES: bifunctional (p)ppGpp synthetase/guanosine-3',5'-bis(diphosphate) 3'-pyrophosphohydrolase [Pseudomonas]KPB28304.1 HD domain protein [Pseudomonas syringae pv. syringae]MCK9709962.1 bifunctional (p)ppGpp synthetase/guanosine-3',5'-bis(diphosphate) 3'-pyrophosphohydrolase [Pseudomonas syringae pv. syringae]MDA7015361.1 bifunctional (p)ppGpp synthetase/guanosine-3',5'-bis(diphosphate) 3'-pyrophosphohydrolase [Pseudomonas cerasi]
MSKPCPQQLYNKAWLFASHAHVGQKMTGLDLPYTTHVAMVANELIFAHREESVGALEIALPTALLEDTPVTQDELAEAFGVEVASAVACLSKNLIVPFSEALYFAGIASHSKEAASVKLCDRITNLQSAPSTWKKAKRASYLVESAQILAALGHANGYLRQRLTDTMARYEALYVDGFED